MNFPIYNWTDIASQFTSSVVIGNGASIAIDYRLSYPSLFDAAVGRGYLLQPSQNVFAFFGTRDFEFVLRALVHANAVNLHLGIIEQQTAITYQHIKQALISTVHAIHPNHTDVAHHLNRAADFLGNFRTVFSLNYDLLIYWAIMARNAEIGANRFKDCFKPDGTFETDYGFMRRPHSVCDASTLIFYPHGNLALVADPWGAETKLKQNQQNLIECITDSWQINGNNPLFVSESDAAKKLLAIRRNGYLSQCMVEMSKGVDSVAVYGWSFGDQDQHLVDQIALSRPRRIAVSVFTQGGFDVQHHCYSINYKLRQTRGLSNADIMFFDSGQPGTWIHPPVVA